MGKATGFLEYERKNNQDIPVKERTKNFQEFHIPLSETERRIQAARCMNCGVPFCQSGMKLHGMVTGCPLHNLIPEWNDQIYKGHEEHALARLLKTSNFPEFTGRVCPALCEKACICGAYGDPVSVHDNELYLIERAFDNGLMRPRIPKIRSGKKVAVIGSGPSGLAVADTLNRRGHSVTVYEREDRIGGLLMYGIPNMKLDKNVIFRRQKLMEEEGVTFITGTDIGRETDATEIKKNYDAVVLCCGAKNPRPLANIDMNNTKGVMFAVDFLSEVTRNLLEKKSEAQIFSEVAGKHVVVVGGGDTGNDCIGTVIRLHCKSVTALEMMPEPPSVRTPENPWPEWPKVKKIDYGHEEAISLYGSDPRQYQTTIKELITGKKGELKKIKTVKLKMIDGKMSFIEGSEQIIPCDLLLIAAGFLGAEEYTAKAFDVERSPQGRVVTTENHYATNKTGIFTAGDMHRGQSLVVWAIYEGRNCAQEVDKYLMGYTI